MNVHQVVRDAIKAKIESVSFAEGTGDLAYMPKVNSFERYSAKSSALLDMYGDPDRNILGWNIVRTGFVEYETSPNAYHYLEQKWLIRAFMGWKDDEETALRFDDYLDAVQASFRTDPFLGGAVIDYEDRKWVGLKLVSNEPVMFANALCHQAAFEYVTRSKIIDLQLEAVGGPYEVYIGLDPETGPDNIDKYIRVGGNET